MKLAAACLLAALGGPAQAETCRLALSLALDVSSSVDAEEYRLQAEGLAAALVAAEVEAAFLGVEGAWVALQVFEWSGRQQQETRLDWTLVRSAGDLARIAARLRGMARSHDDYPTALGYAMGYGATALARGPVCDRRTLDVSGDGANNEGFEPPLAIRAFPFEGVTVNGLVVGPNRAVLRRYFEGFVIHGPGAFVEMAEDYADFKRAMRRKLARELGVGLLSALAPPP